jgi:ferredoxin-NADP reductase
VFNVKIAYPFHKKTITMITVGSGITPMLQALNKLLFTPGDETKIVMLNGNKNEEDILMRKQVHTSLSSSSPASFSC